MFDDFGINAGFVEDLHAQYRQSPQSVDEHWRRFFEARDRGEIVPVRTNGNGAAAPALAEVTQLNGHAPAAALREERLHAAAALLGRVYQLVNAYRVRGHLFAKIDPLGTPPDAAPELDLSNFGLSEADLDVTFP